MVVELDKDWVPLLVAWWGLALGVVSEGWLDVFALVNIPTV